ncbi:MULTISPECIES: Rieske 2Fe-2S domain-containing protein [Bradyrhizobium]|uniref:Rieske 2Fe-2S domain-containing protein n=1 Tax=Bradyrhizobium elkanii TaxID=29448 RepID=UPI0009B7DA89
MAPLSLGRCEGGRLRCMYHGLLFNTDGEVVEIPGQPMIPRHARVRTYPRSAPLRTRIRVGS